MRRRAWFAFHALPAALTIAGYTLVIAPVTRIRTRARRARGDRPRILWGPVPIANLRNSAQADRRAGYSSETLVYRPYRPSDRVVFDHVLDVRLPLVRQLAPYGAFIWAGVRFDIFCFTFDGGLLAPTPFWRVELPLLRLAGKRIVVYPYGGDARLPSRTRALGRWHAYTDVEPGQEDRDEAEVRARLRAFGRWANVVLGCADLVEDLPRLDGIFQYPFDDSGWEPTPGSQDPTVRVVHAPNHRHYKGTRYLVEAVERLRGEGLPVELVLVEGMSAQDARLVYERADVIADQFLIGAYGLFAIEGMALGKPVLCYLNERFGRHHPEWRDCPIVSASPETLLDQLRRLVTDGSLRAALGARGPEYVRRVHSLEAVARRMDAVYRKVW
jgi:glycosyltransferase involved in cell wall biosynthesis